MKTVMFGYLIVISVDFYDFSVDLVLIDEDNVKHSQQCLATFSNTSKFIKNTQLPTWHIFISPLTIWENVAVKHFPS